MVDVWGNSGICSVIYFGVWSDVDLFCFSISPAFHCSISIETVMLNCTGGLFSCCTVWEMIVGKDHCRGK